MKEHKEINILPLIILVVIIIFLIGGTYAWLTLKISDTKTNTLTAGTLKLTLDDVTSEGIKIEKAVPMSDEKGMTTSEYTFTLENTGTIKTNYKIYLDDIATSKDNSRMPDSKIKYQLIKNGEETVALLSSLQERILDTGTMEKEEHNTYTLRVWIDSAAGNEIMGTVFSTKLRVVAEQTRNSNTTAMCKRATTLHKETCTYACQGDGYANGEEIEYGSLGKSGILTSGDAFDCDVNGDGIYDESTERFYYVSNLTNGVTEDSNIAVLVYYNNVSGGVASNNVSSAYNETGMTWNGPITAIKQLPTTNQWKTTLTNPNRSIKTDTSTDPKVGDGTELTPFSYDGYAARLLTYQEIDNGCYDKNTPLTTTKGLSTKCKYMYENTRYSSALLAGWWLETPKTDGYDIWTANGTLTSLFSLAGQSSSTEIGVRPAIEVAKSNISY